MFLINCEIELALTFSANCTICKVDTATTVAITDTKLYVSLFPGGHYENFVQLILHFFFFFGLEVLDDRPVISSIDYCQEK